MSAMSTDPHASDTPDHAAVSASDHHAGADHGDDHGHDDHGHGEDALGPIDTAAWLAGALGVLLGIAVTVCFVLATADVQALPV
jgi:ABC-type Zn2+ transport system substrate-binding protein/surface adhesin